MNSAPASAPTESELHAFLDGELAPERQRAVAAAIAADIGLARRVAELRALQARFDELAGLLSALPVPERLRQAASTPPGPASRGAWTATLSPWRWGGIGAAAIAASLGLVLGVHTLWPRPGHEQQLLTSDVVTEALAARDDVATPLRQVSLLQHGHANETMAHEADRLVVAALGAGTHTPDLSRMGFRLVSAELYHGGSLQLRYRDASNRLFAVYVHPGRGPDRFALLSRRAVQICLWQNEDASTVMSAELPTPELFRLSSIVYSTMAL